MLVSQTPHPAPAAVVMPPKRLKLNTLSPWRPLDKVVVVMGPTGTGKSRLSLDLAAQFPAEVINSDKIQIHKGLDITTNKITEEEQNRVPHHLLGILSPDAEFTAADFCDRAWIALDSITSRGKLPVIAGGSNSYIEALIDGKDFRFRSKFECCFLWVDVEMPVLKQYVAERVDRMVENGLVEEARAFFSVNREDYKQGIRKAIGVPELDRYFRSGSDPDLLEKAIEKIKENTCRLACRQLEKIRRLREEKKWKIHKIDATEV